MKRLYAVVFALTLFAIASQAGNKTPLPNVTVQPPARFTGKTTAQQAHAANAAARNRSLTWLLNAERYDTFSLNNNAWLYVDSLTLSYTRNLHYGNLFVYLYYAPNWDQYAQENYSYNSAGNEVADSVTIYSSLTSLWRNYSRDSTYYDANGYESEYIEYAWDTINNVWDPSYEYLYSNDANGNTLSETALDYNTGTSMLTNNYRYTYTYDLHGKELSELYQTWSGTDWTNQSQYGYVYNAGEQEIMDSSQNWTSGAWVNYGKDIYTYNGSGLEVEDVSQYWNSGWVNNYQYIYSYDANGNDTAALTYAWNSGDNSFDNNYSREIYHYNTHNSQTLDLYTYWVAGDNAYVYGSEDTTTYNGNNNELTYQVLDYDTTTQVWTPQYAYTYAYDGNNNNTYELYQLLDRNNQTLTNSEEYYYYYEQLQGIDTPKDELGVIMFPNPATSNVNLQFTLDQPASMVISVYDNCGRILSRRPQSMAAGANTTGINTSNLASGIYTVQLVNTATQQSSVLKLVKE